MPVLEKKGTETGRKVKEFLKRLTERGTDGKPLTQTEIAARLHVSFSTVYKWMTYPHRAPRLQTIRYMELEFREKIL